MALTYSFLNFEPVHCSMSSSKCCFLTCIQVSQEAGKVVWYSQLFQNFLQFVVSHTVKGSSIVNEAKVGIFSGILLLSIWSNECWQFDLWLPCLSKSNLYIWKFSIQVLLKPSLKNFEHNFTSLESEHNCPVVWMLFSTARLSIWGENWPFEVHWLIHPVIFSLIQEMLFIC